MLWAKLDSVSLQVLIESGSVSMVYCNAVGLCLSSFTVKDILCENEFSLNFYLGAIIFIVLSVYRRSKLSIWLIAL